MASALAHMGFWDRWQAERWTEMLAGSWSGDDESLIAAEHLANDALDPYWAGIDAPELPALALEAAARLDALIASAPDAMVDAIEGGVAPTSCTATAIAASTSTRSSGLSKRQPAPPHGRSTARSSSAMPRVAGTWPPWSARLTAADCTRPTEPSEEGSWTIAQVLGHLAFWDRSWEARWLMEMEAAGEDGAVEPVSIPSSMTETINRPLAALLGEWTEPLGVAVGAQAVAAAESLDALLESLVDRIPAGAAAERPALVNRWAHREPHLAAVEAALVR